MVGCGRFLYILLKLWRQNHACLSPRHRPPPQKNEVKSRSRLPPPPHRRAGVQMRQRTSRGPLNAGQKVHHRASDGRGRWRTIYPGNIIKIAPSLLVLPGRGTVVIALKGSQEYAINSGGTKPPPDPTTTSTSNTYNTQKKKKKGKKKVR